MKKVNINKLIVVFLIIVLAALIYFLVKPSFGISEGDKVKVDYTLYVNGGVYETTIIEDAKESGIFDETRDYKPFEFIIGSGGVLGEFDDAVKKMKINEEKNIEISAVKGYGDIDENKIIRGLRRGVVINKTSMIDLNSFKELFAREPVLNEFIEDINFPWEIKVIAMKDSVVTIENVLKKGEKIVLPGSDWDSIVEDVSGNSITIKQYPEIGDNLIIPGQFILRAKVIDVKEDVFNVDLNHPLAGKDLKFKIILREIEKKR